MTRYEKLLSDLAAIEEKTGLYLADPSVDAENVEDPTDHDALYAAAVAAAGARAERAGADINDLLGRVVY